MITSISTDWGVNPRIVRITTTDSLSTIVSPGYLASQQEQISLLNNGEFAFFPGDLLLIFYNFGDGFFTIDQETGQLVPSGEGEVTAVLGTTNQIDVDSTDPAIPVVSIADNPVIPGAEGMTIPVGSLEQRPISPAFGEIRANTTFNDLEYWNGTEWVSIAAPGTGVVQTIVGTENEISIDSTDPENPIVSIANNPILPGIEGFGIPAGQTDDRPIAPYFGQMRANTTTGYVEYYDGASWISITPTSGGNVSTDGTAIQYQIPLFTDGYNIEPSSLTDNGILVATPIPFQASNLIARAEGNFPGTGTVDVTNGSPVVLGTATTFSSELGSGAVIIIGGNPYQISYVMTDSILFLTDNYAGVTASDIPFFYGGNIFEAINEIGYQNFKISANGDISYPEIPSDEFMVSILVSSPDGASSHLVLQSDILRQNISSIGRYDLYSGSTSIFGASSSLINTATDFDVGIATDAGRTLTIHTSTFDTYRPKLISSNSDLQSYLTLQSDNFVFDVLSLMQINGSLYVTSNINLDGDLQFEQNTSISFAQPATFNGISADWDVLYFQQNYDSRKKGYFFSDGIDDQASINIITGYKGSVAQANAVTLDIPNDGLWYFGDSLESSGVVTAFTLIAQGEVSGESYPFLQLKNTSIDSFSGVKIAFTGYNSTLAASTTRDLAFTGDAWFLQIPTSGNFAFNSDDLDGALTISSAGVVRTFNNVLDDSLGVMNIFEGQLYQIDITTAGGNSAIGFNAGDYYIFANPTRNQLGITQGLVINSTGAANQFALNLYDASIGDAAFFCDTLNHNYGVIGTDYIVFSTPADGYTEFFHVYSKASATNKGTVTTLHNMIDDGFAGNGAAQFFGNVGIGDDYSPDWRLFVRGVVAVNSVADIPATNVNGGVFYTQYDAGLAKTLPFFKDDTGAVTQLGAGSGGGGTVTSVDTTTDLTVDGTPGGSFTVDGIIGLADTTVVAGTYQFPEVILDAKGRSTSATNLGYYNSPDGNLWINGTGTSFHTDITDTVIFGADADVTNDTVIGAVVIGAAAGASNGGVSVGYLAGAGSNGHLDAIFIGNSSDATLDSLSNCMALGANTRVSQSDAFVYGDNTVFHGMGTRQPLSRLHLVNGSNDATSNIFRRNGIYNLSNTFPATDLVTQHQSVVTDGVQQLVLLSVPISNGLDGCISAATFYVSAIIGDGGMGTSAAFGTVTCYAHWDGGNYWLNGVISGPPIPITLQFSGTSLIYAASAQVALTGGGGAQDMQLEVTGVNAYHVVWQGWCDYTTTQARIN